MVTWGTSPEHALPIGAVVPDPTRASDEARRQATARALEYMDLGPGTRLEGLPVDRVFIGSCTNSRIEDLRAAAAVCRGPQGRRAALVVPGSGLVKEQAEAEGLDRVFNATPAVEWRDAGCSMCVGMNGDIVPPGERCRLDLEPQFRGRQGKGVRTHLVSPPWPPPPP